MKALFKILTVLAVLTGLLALAAALFAEEQKPEYIRLYGGPDEA